MTMMEDGDFLGKAGLRELALGSQWRTFVVSHIIIVLKISHLLGISGAQL